MTLRTRLSLTTLLCLAVFVAPWWLFAIVLAGSFLFVDNFVEGIVLAFLFDILYGSPATSIFLLHSSFLFTMCSVALFAASFFIREALR